MTDEPQSCFNDYVELCRHQKQRIDTLEAANRAAIEEIDTLPNSQWTIGVVRTLLSHALKQEQVE